MTWRKETEFSRMEDSQPYQCVVSSSSNQTRALTRRRNFKGNLFPFTFSFGMSSLWLMRLGLNSATFLWILFISKPFLSFSSSYYFTVMCSSRKCFPLSKQIFMKSRKKYVVTGFIANIVFINLLHMFICSNGLVFVTLKGM